MQMIDLRSFIRDVSDFPKQGIVFKDITPLLLHPGALTQAISAMAEAWTATGITKVVAIESRGFLFGGPVAVRLGAGLVPVRKPGKLPWAVVREEYALEYGFDKLEIHRDAIHPGERILIIDDVLATGGTAAATARLVETLGGVIAGLGFVIELDALGGRKHLGERPVKALLHY